jgi:hypothetical protein
MTTNDNAPVLNLRETRTQLAQSRRAHSAGNQAPAKKAPAKKAAAKAPAKPSARRR